MIRIRPTTFSDASLLCRIQQQAFLPLYERYHDEHNPCLRGEEDITSRLTSSTFRYFTILNDGNIVGGIFFKCAGSIPHHGKLQNGEYYLQRIYILPSHQGQKIAQTAIRLCEETFTDAVAFFVDFPSDLVKNRRCYEAAGYKDTGETMHVGNNLTLSIYEKHL